MATETELAASAVAHAQKTTKTWDWYLNKIRTDPSYRYNDPSVEWYKAGADLEATKHLAPPPGPPPPSNLLTAAQARIFLADSPLECLVAPDWMTPVITADQAYRSLYTPNALGQLRRRFGTIEAWCDCNVPSGSVPGQGTGYDVAQQMVRDLGLAGPAWGQCESRAQFDNAYQGGARRMVGGVDPEIVGSAGDWRFDAIQAGHVLVSVELYRNKQPGVTPNWRNLNPGIGGDCIACYESASEGALYTPVASYIEAGLYVAGRDSVYGVGLRTDDWRRLAG